MTKKILAIIAFIYIRSLTSNFVEKTDLASLAFTGVIMYGAYLHNATHTKNNIDSIEVATTAELENFIALLKKYLIPEDAEKIISRLKVRNWTDKSSSLKDYTIPLAFTDLLISLIMRTNYILYVPKIAVHAICGEKMFCYTDPKRTIRTLTKKEFSYSTFIQKYIEKIFEQNKDLGKIEFLSENKTFYDLLKSLEQEIQYIASLQTSFPAIHLYYNTKNFNETKNHAYYHFFNEQTNNKQKELEDYIGEVKKMKDYFSRKLTSENIISYNNAYISLLSQLEKLQQLNTKIAEKEIKNLENFKVILEEKMNNKHLEEKEEVMKEKQKNVFTTCRTIESIMHKSTEFNTRASELRQQLIDRNLRIPQFLQKQYTYSKDSSIKEVSELGKTLESCVAKCDIIYNNVFELNKMVPCIFDFKKILEDRYEIIKNNGNIKNEMTLKKLKELIDENFRLISSINIENIQKERIQEKVLIMQKKLQEIME